MEQSPASFVNAMEGAALRQRRELDHATFLAWHTAVFAIERYAGKLKPLSKYLGSETTEAGDPKIQHAKILAWAHSLRVRGVDIKIERVTRH